MGFGGYHPYPRRFGGGRTRLETIHESINASRGTAYSKDRSSVVWVENMAIARALAAAWSTNQRLANQTDPRRMTDMLGRWERILAIPVPASATEADRRAEVLARFERIGKASVHSRIYSECVRVLGSFFVAVEYIDIANANVVSPDASYPWGHQAPAPYVWYSTVAHILIKMTQPAGYTDADFWAKAAAITPVMDDLLPVEVTWDWYRCPRVGAGIEVVGGPSCAGWYLDEPNLDILVFDV